MATGSLILEKIGLALLSIAFSQNHPEAIQKAGYWNYTREQQYHNNENKGVFEK